MRLKGPGQGWLARLAAGGLLSVGLLVFCAHSAAAHGANFKDPSDSPKRSARPSPLESAPPVVTPDAGLGVQPVWRPEGWYRWWELNASRYLEQTRPAAKAVLLPFGTPPAVTTGKGEATPTLAPVTLWRSRFMRHLLALARPEAKTSLRLRAAALVTLGRVGRGPAPTAMLRAWASDKAVAHEMREAAILGLALLRRDSSDARLSPAALEGVRSCLLTRVDDLSERPRTRAFAILALGMLADQGHPDTPQTRDGRHMTRALWQRCVHTQASSELSIAVLTALGMQPPAGVPGGVIEGLRGIVLGERVRNRGWGPYERSHALTALARLGGRGVDALLLRLVRSRREHVAMRAATALALAQRAEALTPAARLAAFRALREAADAPSTPWLIRGLTQVAMGAVLGADLRADSEAILIAVPAAVTWLQDQAINGPREGRPFCALAMGLASHRRRVGSLYAEGFHTRSEWLLREQLQAGARSDRMLGSFAVALGLMRAYAARELLVEQLKERARHPMLRGHCAAALGMLDLRDPELGVILLASSRERSQVFLHIESARALGRLGVEKACVRLQRRFVAETNPSIAAGLALGLAAHGNPSAVPALLKRQADPKQHVGIRVTCTLALGVLLAPNPGRSVRRMAEYANYTALPAGMRRFLDSL